MSFLTALGLALPVASITRSPAVLGADAMQLLGLMRTGMILRREQWDVECASMVGADADSFDAILDGRAHVFPWDADHWSSRGLRPADSTPKGAITAGGKFGSYLDCTATEPTYAIEFFAPGKPYTLVYWRLNGAAWDHYVERSDGKKWLNGVRNDAINGYNTVDLVAGTILVGIGAAGTGKLDDMGVFPGWISTTHAPLLFTFHNTTPLSLMRRCTFAGDLRGVTGNFTAIVTALKSKAAMRMNGSTFDNAARALTFTVTETKT